MARPGLDRNVKFRALCRMLAEPRPHVRGYLELLWEVAYENGNPVIGDASAIESASEYPGEPGKLFRALLTCGGEGQAGFIETVPENASRYQVHDLYDHAPDYVQKRRQRELERLAKASRQRRSPKTADNGGQRPPKSDNGAPPTPSPTPTPLPSSNEEGCWAGESEGASKTTRKRDDGTSPDLGESDKARPRPRDELFDVIAEVTASDLAVSGSHIGRLRRLLLKADPPYIPDEVRRWADMVTSESWWKGGRPSLSFMEKDIGRVRAKPPPAKRDPYGSSKRCRDEKPIGVDPVAPGSDAVSPSSSATNAAHSGGIQDGR